MKILVANNDRTPELQPRLLEQSKRCEADPRCAFLPWTLNALSLRDAKDGAAYYRRFLELIRYKNHVDTLVFEIPRRAGFAGALMARFKRFLWKLLRYQHDRMAFRQNLINSQLTSALEFQQAEIKKLEDRLSHLERGGDA